MKENDELMTADGVIEAIRNGDVTVEDADKVEDIDGWTIRASYLTQNGFIHIYYSLDEVLSSRPSIEEEGYTRFNVIEDEVPTYPSLKEGQHCVVKPNCPEYRNSDEFGAMIIGVDSDGVRVTPNRNSTLSKKVDRDYIIPYDSYNDVERHLSEPTQE